MTKNYLFLVIILFLGTMHAQDLLPFKLFTVLTEPVNKRTTQKYTGHPAVTRSLVEGLKKKNIPFNYNPSDVKMLGDVVLVLASIEALRQAIKLKREGKIKFLLAGPNLVWLPRDHNHLIASKEIDLFFVPSVQTRDVYAAEEPCMKDSLRAWPAGVDQNYWCSSGDRIACRNVLVYWKNESEDFCKQVESILRSYHWNPLRLKYGSHSHTKFKSALQNCRFAVFISKSESQGLALVEAWSMNIPTLCWNPGQKDILGTIYTYSSCPYLNDSVGKDWYSLDEFTELLCNIDQILANFTPRKWVQENMTDEVSVDLLLKIIKEARLV